MPSSRFDVAVIGGGIIGLATAMLLAEKYPKVKVVVFEKESELATHQTGHNSGVIHSGIYYRPGSVKAQTCVSGKRALLEFCDRHGIPYELCGKVIVATQQEELPRLEELMRRGTANGVYGLEIVGPERLREIEPYARGIKALYSPSTGIIDFRKVAHAYATRLQDRGGEILTSHKVMGIVERGDGLIIETPSGEFFSRYLINCGGLFTDRVAAMVAQLNFSKDRQAIFPRIVPFRGEYFRLIRERRSLTKGLIYPVPNPSFPFLGVHFTRTVHGDVEVGPNAVFAFAREGYRKSDINLRDMWQTLSYRGFWSMVHTHWRMGCEEFYRSISTRAFVKALQKLVPDVNPHDLIPAGSGVRAQAVSPRGDLIDDFFISQTPKAIHVLNAPSPGATASLAIGETVVNMAAKSSSLVV